jgi:hypothetical protein
MHVDKYEAFAYIRTPSQTCLCTFVRVFVGALWLFGRRLRIASSLIAKKKNQRHISVRESERGAGRVGRGGCRSTVSDERRLGGRTQRRHEKRCVAREGGGGR